MRRIVQVGAAALMLTFSGACSEAALPPLGDIAIINSPADIKLPTDQYEPTDGQVATIKQAADIETSACVKSFGIQPPTTFDLTSPPTWLNDRERSTLYGYFSPGLASVTGYDRIVQPLQQSAPPSPEARLVLSGREDSGATATIFAGKAIPADGCLGAGKQATGGPLPFAGVTGELPDGGPKVPQDDPRLTSAYAAWHTCMQLAGFSYKTPVDAYFDPRWIAGNNPRYHSSDEIAAAVADMTCKESTNLMGTIVAVEAGYASKYINSHGDDLVKFRQNLELRVANARKIIANGS